MEKTKDLRQTGVSPFLWDLSWQSKITVGLRSLLQFAMCAACKRLRRAANSGGIAIWAVRLMSIAAPAGYNERDRVRFDDDSVKGALNDVAAN
jgi:hypothetical protein